MFAIPSTPAKQSVGETIGVLSGRLGSSTLLEDRRAAILGLRSFAKDFPATVASGALRSLIGSLSNDNDDVDTVKVVLETLLMLFDPSVDSPEASPEIALWLADEFTQRQENITLLLDFLDSSEFYSRLYSLRLLAAIHSARPEKTEESVFNPPPGISRLMAVLDDNREAVRNEAVVLLTSLTSNSTHIQNLVAYENAFDRLFSIINAEGSLAEGGRVVEDCLVLLANVVRINPSNQSQLRESGCFSKLAALLQQAYNADSDGADVAYWAQTQRNRNVYAVLAVVRLFLTVRSSGTQQNQAALWKSSVLFNVLQLAFNPNVKVQIQAEALATCADLIRGNASLQENFAQLLVPTPYVADGVSDRASGSIDQGTVFVIDGLLELTLNSNTARAFDVRLAACECLKAYFWDHSNVRLHFLGRAIEGHQSGRDEASNILTVLLHPISDTLAKDPYVHWFAAVIMYHLLSDSAEAKTLAMTVTEGDASNGEEVVTAIQTITAHLLTGLRRLDDERVLAGYLMLLLGWLFENMDAVNDFLGEGSNVQSLAQIVAQPILASDVVSGLGAMLLGFVYEFSTKESPVSRTTLHSMLHSCMGRDVYIERLGRLRSHSLMRDFELTFHHQNMAESGSPAVYFDSAFVEFFKDNYSRAIRAIDREPGMEISVVSNGVQQGISRELVDSLTLQLQEKERHLQDLQQSVMTLQAHIGQEQASAARSAAELTTAMKSMESLKVTHEQESRRITETLERQHEEAVRIIQDKMRSIAKEHQHETESCRKQAETDIERIQRRGIAEKADLKATISRLEVDLLKADKTKTQQIQELRDDYERKLSDQALESARLMSRVKDLETELKKAELGLVAALSGQKATQGEFDDMLMVFGDLEEKVTRYKTKLAEIGHPVSDAEEDVDHSDDEDSEAGSSSAET